MDCPACSWHLPNVHEFQSHFVSEHIEIICEVCVKPFSKFDDFKKHPPHDGTRLSCDECNKSYETERDWTKHAYRHHVQICSLCQKFWLSDLKGYQQHCDEDQIHLLKRKEFERDLEENERAKSYRDRPQNFQTTDYNTRRQPYPGQTSPVVQRVPRGVRDQGQEDMSLPPHRRGQMRDYNSGAISIADLSLQRQRERGGFQSDLTEPFKVLEPTKPSNKDEGASGSEWATTTPAPMTADPDPSAKLPPLTESFVSTKSKEQSETAVVSQKDEKSSAQTDIPKVGKDEKDEEGDASLLGALHQVTGNLQKRNSELQESKELVKKLEADLDALKKKTFPSEEQLKKAEEEKRFMEDQNLDLMSQFSRLNQGMMNAKRECTRLQNMLHDQGRSAEVLAKDKEVFEKQAFQLELDLNNAKEIIRELQNKLDASYKVIANQTREGRETGLMAEQYEELLTKVHALELENQNLRRSSQARSAPVGPRHASIDRKARDAAAMELLDYHITRAPTPAPNRSNVAATHRVASTVGSSVHGNATYVAAPKPGRLKKIINEDSD